MATKKTKKKAGTKKDKNFMEETAEKDRGDAVASGVNKAVESSLTDAQELVATLKLAKITGDAVEARRLLKRAMHLAGKIADDTEEAVDVAVKRLRKLGWAY